MHAFGYLPVLVALSQRIPVSGVAFVSDVELGRLIVDETEKLATACLSVPTPALFVDSVRVAVDPLFHCTDVYEAPFAGDRVQVAFLLLHGSFTRALTLDCGFVQFVG